MKKPTKSSRKFKKPSHQKKRKNETGITKAKANCQIWKKSNEGKGKVFAAIHREYRESRENNNECLNFSKGISKPKEYTACLKMNGITKFTFSSDWRGAIENALELQKNGFPMTVLTTIKGREDAWTGEQ